MGNLPFDVKVNSFARIIIIIIIISLCNFSPLNLTISIYFSCNMWITISFLLQDEEVYQLFCGINNLGSSVEAIRIIRDPNYGIGKGIAYVLFRTRVCYFHQRLSNPIYNQYFFLTISCLLNSDMWLFN